MSAALELTPQVFAILSALIEERTGIHYPPHDRELLRDKISTRAVEAGFESLLDYYYFLRYDAGAAAEFDRLIESLVVRETYFFREFDQLRTLVERLIAPVVATGRRLRVWSSACSTGEEPLTLAMLLDAAGLLDHVELSATDLSPVALERAQSGRFGGRSVRQVPDATLVSQYLTRDGEAFRVRPDLIGRVQWGRLNLTDAAAIAARGQFDVILCRNVLIYFRDSTARQVVDHLSARLNPGGALVVSVSESLLRFGTTLDCEEHGGVFFYRKRHDVR